MQIKKDASNLEMLYFGPNYCSNWYTSLITPKIFFLTVNPYIISRLNSKNFLNLSS